jgi:signal transduction histidine kinase
MVGEADTKSKFRARFGGDSIRSAVPTFDLTPGLVTAIYCVLGFSALYFSDVYLPQAIEQPAILRREQALKGGVEVLLTAGLIFVLTKRSRLALERYQGRLEHLQAERSVLHRVFRHNLRQELNLIEGHSRLIREEDDQESRSSHCDVIETAADRTEEYVEMTRRFERMLHSRTELRPIDLVAMVDNDDEVARLREADDVDLVVEMPAEIRATGHSHVMVAFHEVLENAVKHNPSPRKRIEITVRERGRDLVELAVSDNGPGIPEIERRAIESMEELPLTHSGGLGLWFAKLACTVAGGDLVIEDGEAGGAEVRLQYPAVRPPTIRQRLATLWAPRPDGDVGPES